MSMHITESVKVKPGSQCPSCGLQCTGAAGVVADKTEGVPTPSPGDFTVCIACGNVLAFDENLQLRKLTPAEERDVSKDDRVQMIRNAVYRVHRAKLLR
jgi:Na+-translocating ferredoxin:NAD+ oxidoreductase RNF subunit RnfB